MNQYTKEHVVCSEESNLCLSCGMCCDGTLFSYGITQKEDAEVSIFKQLGFEFSPHNKLSKVKFALPCFHHQNSACQIYQSERPAICSRFSCATLSEMRAGTISLQKALQRVDVMRSIVNELKNGFKQQGFPDTSPSFNKTIVSVRDHISQIENPTIEQKKLLLSIVKYWEYQKNFK